MKMMKNNWHRIALGFILVLTGFLSFFAAWKEGYANQYYSAAVKSMLGSWHNFFFASFDPGGYVTVDKPALGLWLQTAFAKVFGFHGWSMILPEALCTVVSVAVLYHITGKFFGKTAGILSALVLSVTPVLIAVSRTNNLDASLVMVLMLAAGALITACEKGSVKWLLISMMLVGLGFNIKMLEAFMVLPAFYLAYFFTSRVKISRRILNLAVATAVLMVVSLSWAVIVDLTPADQRPFVGSSQTNSELNLALGYNGLQRVTGNSSNHGGGMPGDGLGRGFDGRGGAGGFGGPGGAGENGQKGFFRIFNKQLGGQISWLLPMALFGMVILLIRVLDKGNERRRTLMMFLILWGVWIAAMLGYFSIAGFFHRYYLSMLAPGIAALGGIGLVEMWRAYMERSWKWVLLPISLVTTAAVQGILLWRYPSWRTLLISLVCGLCLAAAVALSLIRILKMDRLGRTIKLSMAVGLAGLLIAPVVWAATPIVYGSQAQIPYAGPELAQGGGFGNNRFGGMPGGGGQDSNQTSGLLKFLLSQKKGEKFLVAVPDAGTAESIILETGEAVMAIGGFSGSDQILTVEKLQTMVEKGELRYFMAGGFGRGGHSDITNWVMQHGTSVSSDKWSSTGSSRDGFGWGGDRMGNGTLYDLAPEKG